MAGHKKPAESKGWWVYIARMKDGRLYAGHTSSLPRRCKDHVRGDGSRTTRIFGFQEIVHSEKYPFLSEAMKRGRQLKRWTRAKKLALISADLEKIKDLSRSRRKRP